MNIVSYLKTQKRPQRKAFAERCGTTLGHLMNVAYGCKPCSESLAIAIDRETGGQVSAEELCPNSAHLFAYLRKSASPAPGANAREAA